MNDKLFGRSLAAFIVLAALLVGGSFWYYTLGRKPKLIVSTPIGLKTGTPISHMTGPGEVLLLVGTKATLYDTAAGKQKWTSDFTPPSATPPPVPSATPLPVISAKGTPPESNTKHDPMNQILEARIARRAAKLDAWAAQLNTKRAAKLDTPLKVANFNEEEAKYHAEMAEARAEKAALRDGSGVPPASLHADLAANEMSRAENSFELGRSEVFSGAAAIWVAQGRGVRMLDRANGRLIKEIPLAGNFEKVMPGAGSWYVTAINDEGARQITCIAAADGGAKVIEATGTSDRGQFAWRGSGRAEDLQRQRTEFSASGAELAQLDVQLIEEKITERQALKGDSASDWEAADKKGPSGWSSDAMGIVEATANDAQREMTGGKERIDESTYEVVLRRPFNAGIPASIPFKVQGRPEIFSTASFDLVVAGKSLIAFDHANKKVWEATLAFPVSTSYLRDESESATVGSLTRPCLEDEKRLYFFDKGFLTAFDRNSGATLWRLPSVGICKVQLDSGAVLYVTSGNGSAQSLQYSQQVAAPTLPVLYKIDAASGKILWKQEKYDDCFVSGGSVYVTLETRNAADLVNSVFQSSKAIATRFKLYKLSARTGAVQWEWFQTRRPLRIDADKKKVSLLFADELQVLKSLAL